MTGEPTQENMQSSPVYQASHENKSSPSKMESQEVEMTAAK